MCSFTIHQDDSENDFIMYCRAKSDQELCKIRVPKPETFFYHRNHEHCFRGSFFGSAMLLVSLISVGIYVTWNFEGRTSVSGSHVKSSKCVELCKVILGRLLVPKQDYVKHLDWSWTHCSFAWNRAN